MDNILILKNDKTNFTMISNKLIRSGKLSSGAYAILSYMLSMPNYYKFSHKTLLDAFPDITKFILTRKIKELKKINYLETFVRRGRNGVITHHEWIIDVPF